MFSTVNHPSGQKNVYRPADDRCFSNHCKLTRDFYPVGEVNKTLQKFCGTNQGMDDNRKNWLDLSETLR
jgi:hypothetical protein